MVSEKRLKGYGGKGKEEGVSKSAKYGGIALLLIMVFSIGGFALMSGGGYSQDSDQGGQQNFPLTENAFQNSQTGEAYWGAIFNGERFVFSNGIDGYEDFQNMANLATKLKTKQNLNIQIIEGFESADAIYLINEKLLPVFSITTQDIAANATCDENTLVFTNTASENTICLEFVAPQGEETQFADILTYHMIKDFN